VANNATIFVVDSKALHKSHFTRCSKSSHIRNFCPNRIVF